MSPGPCIIIVGASSGIGYATAVRFARMGWRVGVAARRIEPLCELAAQYPEHRIHVARIDVTDDDAGEQLIKLADSFTEGPDYILHCAGIGYTNRDADINTDINTVNTNVVAFTRIIDTAYHYMASRGHGHVAAITSVAATRGLGIAASYSASKRYQATYLQALDQLAHIRRQNVFFTDIRPGFASTDLLDPSRRYPMLMSAGRVADGIVRALLKRKRVAVIDGRWNLLVGLWRLIPNALWRRLRVDL